MFTGIVEATGEVRAREETADGLWLSLGVPFRDVTPGDSIAVSGVCLTAEAVGTGDETVDSGGAAVGAGEAAVDPDGETVDARAMAVDAFLASETVARTYLGDLSVGDPVNLERPMPADGRFDGHLVQGHVDATAEVTAIERVGADWRYTFSLPADLAPYVVEKGSIAVDGISLTVADLAGDGFAVAVVPETDDRTTLAAKTVGDPVHLEVDVLAKYVERQLQASNSVGSGS